MCQHRAILRYALGVLLIPAHLTSFYSPEQVQEEVCFYDGTHTEIYDLIKDKLAPYGIPLKTVSTLDRHSPQLHIICDASLVPEKYFPEHYIVYQTFDLDEVPLTKSYMSKLTKAVAVWDPYWKNISKYALVIDNFYYFAPEYIDPLLLPCLLPTRCLKTYKTVLCYSNNNDTDISSHLPTLFAHCILKMPKTIIEAGIRGGESTHAFTKTLEFCEAKLIGIDIDAASHRVYQKLPVHVGEFFTMDDCNFAKAWRRDQNPEKCADIIFIDTSHYYEHTLQELESFVPLLSPNGMLIFHDTNLSPLKKNTYKRINNTLGIAWNNQRGVVRAIQDFFGIVFDETQYVHMTFYVQSEHWALLHYPYCNGLTLIKRLGNA